MRISGESSAASVASRGSRYGTWMAEPPSRPHDSIHAEARPMRSLVVRIVDPKFKAGGARAQLAGYASAKVLDEYSVQVSFETPYAPFLAYSAAGTLSMVSPKAVRESGDLVHTRPVGSGAFMMKEYVAK